MSHQTVFIKHDDELLQAVIKPVQLESFIALGFTTTAESAKDSKPKRAPRKAKTDDNQG